MAKCGESLPPTIYGRVRAKNFGIEARLVNFLLTIWVQFWIVRVWTKWLTAAATRQFCPDGCIFDRSTLGRRANARWGLEVRVMFGPEVRAEAPVLSVFVALIMIVAGTLGIACPLALAIILICS
jgi:hypothetical protein